jgi:ribokinase
MRIAVIGHVEHVVIGRAGALPAAGEIVHLDALETTAGGGGGIAFFQMANGPGEVHLFTALGNDDAAAAVRAQIEATGAQIHAARREAPHTRDIVLVTPDGERTIIVIGQPLHPRRDDPLPWDVLATCNAAYFTAQDPEVLRAARAASMLVATARRGEAIARSGVRVDVIAGSAMDPREESRRGDYAVPPGALVMTEGPAGGTIETAGGIVRFAAPVVAEEIAGAYGAGDSFAAALTWYLARGLAIDAACERAAVHGAAVLRGINPIAHQLRLE